jgi:hypothetical protein
LPKMTRKLFWAIWKRWVAPDIHLDHSRNLWQPRTLRIVYAPFWDSYMHLFCTCTCTYHTPIYANVPTIC